MESSFEILFYISQTISVLTTLIIIVASIILFTKKRTLATWLILIGAVLTGLTFLGGSLSSVFTLGNNVESILNIQGISAIAQSLSYLIFAVGLILLVISEFSQNKS